MSCNRIEPFRYVMRTQESRVSAQLVDPDEPLFRSTTPCILRFLGSTVRFPENSYWNLASIPRVCWRVIAPHELGAEATLAHDKLYEYEGALPEEWFLSGYRTFTRKESDRALLELSLRWGAKPWRAHLAYRTLRVRWSVTDTLRISNWETT